MTESSTYLVNANHWYGACSQPETSLQEPATYDVIAPVSRLFPELLTAVFHLYIGGGLDQSDSLLQALLCLTRVCHTWRDAALEDPTLWTTISLNHPKWATESLIRSRMAPLSIHWIIRYRRFPARNASEQLFHQLTDNDDPQRTRNINIQSTFSIFCYLLSRLEGYGDNLEYMRFECSEHVQDAELEPLLVLLPIFPKLKHVSFCVQTMHASVRVPIGRLMCIDSLTTLHIILTREYSDIDYILAILSLTHALKRFSIIGTGSNQVAPKAPTRPGVRLNLGRLHIDAMVDYCVLLLSHISCPSSTHLELNASRYNRGTRAELDEALSHFAQLCGSKLHPGSKGLQIHRSTAHLTMTIGEFRLRPKIPSENTSQDLAAVIFDVSARIRVETKRSNFHRVFNTFVSVLPLHSIQYMQVKAGMNRRTEWGLLISACPRVKLIQTNADNDIEALCWILSQEANDSRLRFAPNLEALQIMSKAHLARGTMRALGGMVNVRNADGAKLQCLGLADCSSDNRCYVTMKEQDVVDTLLLDNCPECLKGPEHGPS